MKVARHEGLRFPQPGPPGFRRFFVAINLPEGKAPGGVHRPFLTLCGVEGALSVSPRRIAERPVPVPKVSEGFRYGAACVGGDSDSGHTLWGRTKRDCAARSEVSRFRPRKRASGGLRNLARVREFEDFVFFQKPALARPFTRQGKAGIGIDGVLRTSRWRGGGYRRARRFKVRISLFRTLGSRRAPGAGRFSSRFWRRRT